MKYSKYYFEYYALLSLIKCFGYKFEDILEENFESPDWQSESLDIGIEVVRAIDNEDGELNSIINKFFNRGLSGRKIQNSVKKQHPKYGHLFKYKQNIAYCSVPYLYCAEINKIVNAITVKTKKLNKEHFKIFKYNWLYIFADIGLYSDDLAEIQSLIEIDENDKQYDKIFINTTDKILVINRNAIFEEIEVDSKTRKELKAESKKNKP